MRIGFDVAKLAGPRDGIARYTAELLRALVAATDDATAFDLFRGAGPAEEIDLAAAGPLPEDRVRLRVEPWPATGSVDVFHATAWSVPPGYGGPLLYTAYDLTVLDEAASHTVPNRLHVLEGLLEARLRDAIFLVPSTATGSRLAHWLEVEPEQRPMVAPGISTDFGPQGPDVVAAVLDRHDLAGPYVLSVATREPRKNLERLIEAHADLPAPHDDVPLVLVGARGWNGDDLEAKLERGVEHGRIRVLGHVPDGDLPALMSGAAVFAYPSLAEGFGLPVLEALACGAPVVTSNRSSLPEVAGDAALLVDPTDVDALGRALASVLGNDAVAQRLRLAGPTRAAAFSWSTAAAAILDLYHHLAR